MIVSWPSLKRRQAELEDIDRNQIPQNSKDIAIARGYGDLRENTSSSRPRKCRPSWPGARPSWSPTWPARRRPNLTNADTSKVSLGTKVALKDAASGEAVRSIPFSVRGTVILSKGIISYQTAVARALLNHTVGEKIELSTEEGGSRHVVIEKIEPHEYRSFRSRLTPQPQTP